MFGCKNWDDSRIRYDQSNNIIENFMEKEKALHAVSFIFESCNVESIACGIEAVGAPWKIPLPEAAGVKYIGYGDMMFNFLNSDKTRDKIPANNTTYPNNEIIDNLAYCVSIFAEAEAKVHRLNNVELMVADMKALLKAGSAIVLSYTTDYGASHYITVVAYDTNTGEFICYDPWSGNRHCINGGVQERYKDRFFLKRAKNRFIEIWEE